MKDLRFRNTFSVRKVIGKKRKYLNKRTSKFSSEIPIIVIDLTYLVYLFNNKIQSKQSKYYNNTTSKAIKEFFLSLLESVSSLSLPEEIIVVGKPSSGIIFVQLLAIIKELGFCYYDTDVYSFTYSVKANHSIQKPLTLLTNSLSCWALSNSHAKLSFVAVDSNNRLHYYNNKTGLDFFCKMIQTNKVINKLGLGYIKYMGLQYLYIILLYTAFSTGCKTTEFFFDGNYFNQIPKFQNREFYNSLGLGYELVSSAHKFLSYAFLTKPEFCDFFLLGSASEYSAQLTRLVKLPQMDLIILARFKTYYDTLFISKAISFTFPVSFKLPSQIISGSHRLSLLSLFYSDHNEKTSNMPMSSQKQLSLMSGIYHSKYGTFPEHISKLLPKRFSRVSKDVDKIASESVTGNMGISDYVANLLRSL